MQERNLSLVTPPAVEPIALADAKQYCRVDADFTDDDAYITTLITVARQYCEGIQKRAYITQTWEMALKEFRYSSMDTLNNRHRSDVIEIPFGSLQKVNSFQYTDAYGTVTQLAENVDYVVSTRGIVGRVCPPFGKVFPVAILWPLDPIVINFTCGYGDTPEKIPEKVIQAMMMLIVHWYTNRMVINELRGVTPDEIGFAVTALLSLDKIVTL